MLCTINNDCVRCISIERDGWFGNPYANVLHALPQPRTTVHPSSIHHPPIHPSTHPPTHPSIHPPLPLLPGAPFVWFDTRGFFPKCINEIYRHRQEFFIYLVDETSSDMRNCDWRSFCEMDGAMKHASLLMMWKEKRSTTICFFARASSPAPIRNLKNTGKWMSGKRCNVA